MTKSNRITLRLTDKDLAALDKIYHSTNKALLENMNLPVDESNYQLSKSDILRQLIVKEDNSLQKQ